MEARRVRAAVRDGDPDGDVVGCRLRVFDLDVEVAVVIEDAGVEQLVFEVGPRAALIGRDQVGVREGRLRVLVEEPEIRARRRRVEVEVVLLDILAVVALAVGQPEQALLEDGIATVPQGEGETQHLAVVGEAGDPVLAPAVGAGAGLVVAEIRPRVAVLAVVLPDGAPLAFGEIRPPAAPWDTVLVCVCQPLVLGARRCVARGGWASRRGHAVSVSL